MSIRIEKNMELLKNIIYLTSRMKEKHAFFHFNSQIYNLTIRMSMLSIHII